MCKKKLRNTSAYLITRKNILVDVHKRSVTDMEKMNLVFQFLFCYNENVSYILHISGCTEC